MSAKKLTNTDWSYIVDLIDKGYTSGEIHSVQKGDQILDGWWFLTNEGIIVTFS